MDFSDVLAVTERMHWVIGNIEETHNIGKAARDYIDEHVNLEVSAKGFLHILDDCVKRSTQQ